MDVVDSRQIDVCPIFPYTRTIKLSYCVIFFSCRKSSKIATTYVVEPPFPLLIVVRVLQKDLPECVIVFRPTEKSPGFIHVLIW